MNRQTTLSNSMIKRIILFAFLTVAWLPLTQAKTVTLKIATLAPDGTGWMKLMRQAATDIQAETDGRVRLRFFPGGVQGSDKSVLRKMQIRQLQGGAVSTGALAHIDNTTQIYSLPFTFRSVAEIRAVREEFDPYIKESLAKQGYTLLGLSEGGFAYLMSDTPLHDSSKLQQKKVWAPEGDRISATIFEKAGVRPISLPVSDVYTSLQTGLIDTLAANPSSIIAMQWHNKLNYAADYPLVFILGMLVVDSRAFDSINEADQVTVQRIMDTAFRAMDVQNEKDEIAARQALINTGVQFVELNEEDQQAWQQMAADTLTELQKHDIYPVELYQKLLQRLESYRKVQAD